VHNSQPKLDAIMDGIGQKLNLLKHPIRNFDRSVQVVGPGDIEGHLGTDGQYYVLDFGRYAGGAWDSFLNCLCNCQNGISNLVSDSVVCFRLSFRSRSWTQWTPPSTAKATTSRTDLSSSTSSVCFVCLLFCLFVVVVGGVVLLLLFAESIPSCSV
jgi:hypothetical protein